MDKFNNGSNGVFYHGSKVYFDTIKVQEKESGEESFLGSGFYISNDKNVALRYINGSGFLYHIKAFTDSKDTYSLHYSENIPLYLMSDIIDCIDNEYIQDELELLLEDGNNITGKNFIKMIEREGLPVNETLLSCGIDSIVSKINRINTFNGFPDDSLNINVLNTDILMIVYIEKI